MASLPPDSTARARIDYETCGIEHHVQVRFKAPNTIDDVITEFNEWIAAIQDSFYESSFIQASVAADGSNIFNPVAGGWVTSWGSTVGPRVAGANYWDFVGRSLDGRKVRVALFGAKVITAGDDYRATAAESAEVSDAVSVLNAAEGTFLSINGFQPVWKNYANLGINAYWRNKIR